MGKGQKLTTSRSERFLGSGHGHAATFADLSELAEDDVWSMVGDADTDRTDDQSVSQWCARASAESNGTNYSSESRHRFSRNGRRNVGGLSLALEETGMDAATPSWIVDRFQGRDKGLVTTSPRGRHVANSAPVNVPDWSKILPVEPLPNVDDDGSDELDSEMVPPHEYLARSSASCATSVFEGVGRTLKGRDLSRVRDAVWSKTGFHG